MLDARMMPSSEQSATQRVALVALLMCAALWSLNGPLIKLLNDSGQGVDGVTIAFYRSVLGGVVLAMIARPRWSQVRAVPRAWALGSLLSFTVMSVSFVLATTWTSAANAIVLQYTAPVWVFVLSWRLLGERARGGDLLVLAVTMIGVAVIFLGHPAVDIPALAVALLSGLGFGALTVTLRGLKAVDPVLVTLLNSLGSGAVLGVWALLAGLPAMSGRQWALMAVLGVTQFALPYVLYSWALQRVVASRASLIVLVETMLNPLWTWLLVGEAVGRPTLMGAPFILAGVVVNVLRRGRKPAANG